MKVMISGGTGMIGSALASSLVNDGHEVVILTRQNSPANFNSNGIRFVQWDGKTANDWVAELENTDAVVNLTGENLSNSLWTEKQKRKIVASRVDAGKAMVDGFAKVSHKPGVLIQASGSGAYGTSEERIFTESDDYGSDFLAEVTRDWEASTLPVEKMDIRRVIIRSGVVLGKKKGALRLMTLPFRFFVGGKLGSGRQCLSWVHLEDEVRAIRFLIENENAHGIINLSAAPVRNEVFSKIAGKIMHRPAWLPMPAFLLKIILGEMSIMVLEGQNISSEKIQNLGFKFIYPKIDDALRNLL